MFVTEFMFFFFQAEDGIRDLTVTGVQTCALPIYFDGDNFDHTALGFIGGGWIGAASAGGRPIDFRPVPSGTPRWGSEWKRSEERRVGEECRSRWSTNT